jgi:hypothetical protein
LVIFGTSAELSFSISPSSLASSMTGSSMRITDILGWALSARIFSRLTRERVPSKSTLALYFFSKSGKVSSRMY